MDRRKWHVHRRKWWKWWHMDTSRFEYINYLYANNYRPCLFIPEYAKLYAHSSGRYQRNANCCAQ